MGRGFVGRALEIGELDQVLDACLAGQGGLVFVTGDAGIGKSRLLEEATLRARELGMGVAWAACWHAESRSLSPWGQLLDQMGATFPEPGEGIGDPDEARLRLFNDCVATLRRLGQEQARLLVIDDLHWADDASLRLLRHAVGALHTMPVLLAASTRLPVVGELSELVRSSRAISLVGLGEAATAELVRHVAGVDASAKTVSIVHSHTGGNPLFAREWVKLLAAEGRLDDLDSLTDVPWPESVREVVRGRVEGLSQECQDMLGVVSVIGGHTTVEVLARVMRADSQHVLTLLEEAVIGGLASQDRAGQFDLSHPLVRAVVYEDLGVARRVRLHEGAGNVLVAARDDGQGIALAVVADHFLRAAPAGTVQVAVDYARRAAAEATRLFSYEDAVTFLERAVAALDLNPAAADTTNLLIELGHARSAAGDDSGARQSFLSAADAARNAGRGDQLALAALGLSGPSGFEVPLFDRQQVQLLEEALEAVGEDQAELRSWCAARLSIALSLTGVEPRRAALADEAVDLARRAGSAGALAHALGARCDANAGPAECETRLADATEMVELCRTTDERGLELLGRRLRVIALMELGDLVGMDAEIEAFARAAKPLRQPRYDWYVALWRASRALHDRRLDDFERWHAQAEEIGGRSGSPNAEILLMAQRYFGWAQMGRRDEAVVIMDAAIGDQKFTELGVQIAVTMAWNHVLAERLDQARVLIDTVSTDLEALPRDSEWLPTLVQFADVAAAVGGHPSAEWVTAQLAPYADRWVIEGIGAVIRGPVRLLLSPEGATSANSIAREGDVWALTFRAKTVRVRDTKGMRDLARLLAKPGMEIASLDLMGEAPVVEQDTGDTIDAQARRQYRDRIMALEAELDEADSNNDSERSRRLGDERDALLAELSSAYGLGGRVRRTGSSAERARTAVTARIRDTIRRIAQADPELGKHLARSVVTGTFCRYDPDPPTEWTT